MFQPGGGNLRMLDSPPLLYKNHGLYDQASDYNSSHPSRVPWISLAGINHMLCAGRGIILCDISMQLLSVSNLE
jgi:hypothetical protein